MLRYSDPLKDIYEEIDMYREILEEKKKEIGKLEYMIGALERSIAYLIQRIPITITKDLIDSAIIYMKDNNESDYGYKCINRFVMNIVGEDEYKPYLNKISYIGYLDGWNLYFDYDNIKYFVFIPNIENVFSNNLAYINYGKYGLGFLVDDHVSEVFFNSYYIEELSASFKKKSTELWEEKIKNDLISLAEF